MHVSRRPWLRLLALGISCILFPTLTSLARQAGVGGFQPGAGQPLAFEQVVGQPMGLPHLPPQGAWGEVINVTSRWIVIQNHTGQQYPVAVDDIGEFLVRWPIGLDGLTGQSVIEAMGQDRQQRSADRPYRRLRGRRSHARLADL